MPKFILEQRIYCMFSILKAGGDSKEKNINFTTMLQNKIISIFQHRTSGSHVFTPGPAGENAYYFIQLFYSSHELFLIYMKQNKKIY